eukprot:129245-Pelagomonas_calceolata.AAC.2
MGMSSIKQIITCSCNQITGTIGPLLWGFLFIKTCQSEQLQDLQVRLSAELTDRGVHHKAEHRERLQDLQVRLSSLMERISAEDASRIKWSDRRVMGRAGGPQGVLAGECGNSIAHACTQAKLGDLRLVCTQMKLGDLCHKVPCRL